jgi:hypothetical protein
LIVGVDYGRTDMTTFSVYRPRPTYFAPVRTGDVEQMIADIDRVEITRRSEEERLDDVVSNLEREVEAQLANSINLMLFYW